jgi:hypothetical protein
MRRFLLIGILLASAAAANARSRKISDANPASPDMLDVIVQFKHVPGAGHTAKIAGHGGVVKTDLSLVKALHASVPASQLEKLASSEGVTRLCPPTYSNLNCPRRTRHHS